MGGGGCFQASWGEHISWERLRGEHNDTFHWGGGGGG